MKPEEITEEYIRNIEDIEHLRSVCLILLKALKHESSIIPSVPTKEEGTTTTTTVIANNILALKDKAYTLGLKSEYEDLVARMNARDDMRIIKNRYLDLKMKISRAERLVAAKNTIDKWRSMGYNVSYLDDLIEKCDLHGLEVALERTKVAINRIERIKEGLKNLDIPDELISEMGMILSLMKDPRMVGDIEKRFDTLLRCCRTSRRENVRPDALKSMGAGNFIVGKNSGLMNILDNIISGDMTLCPVYIYGVKNTGKTHLLAALYDKSINSGRSPIYVDFRDLNKVTDIDEYDIILIDNFSLGNLEAVRILTNILDRFVNSEKCVIITSCHTPSEIQNILDERSSSRILEGAVLELKPIPMDDFRNLAITMISHYGVRFDDEIFETIVNVTYPSLVKMKSLLNKALNIYALKGRITLEDIKRISGDV